MIPKIGLHVELEGVYWANNSNYMNTNMSQVYPNSQYQNPAFDMVWAWEGQCEYVMSMKTPDANPTFETLNISGPGYASGTYVINTLGGYGTVMSNYASIVGPYCLYRHQNDLVPYCANGTTDCTPMSILRENIQRLIKWRAAASAF